MQSNAVEERRQSIASAPLGAPELAIIVPTLNERDNVVELLRQLRSALRGVSWEVIFVDDSTDGTYELLLRLQRRQPNLRALRQIGRRGLSSACIEGMLASSAPFLAVMDADLQHDERILPGMLQTLKDDDLDIVIGSRFASGGSAGGLSERRLRLSRFGNLLSQTVSHADLSDPMSGFFMLRRSFLDETVQHLSGQGFKILLDLFASAPHPVRFAELPYHFRRRHRGESKLDAMAMLEYLNLLADKMFGRYLPVRFIGFVSVGALGLLVHLGSLAAFFKGLDLPFIYAQVMATVLAMTFNFNLNNVLTYRDRRLHGMALIYGHFMFYAICSIGALGNLLIAETLFQRQVPWALAGLLGAAAGAVWNFGVNSTFTWRGTTRS